MTALAPSSTAFAAAAARLTRQRRLATPKQGFYLILGPEVRAPEGEVVQTARPVRSRRGKPRTNQGAGCARLEAESERTARDRRVIPTAYIQEWAATTPWPDPRQVEQDLIICRALCDIFGDSYLAERLAFRGGTAKTMRSRRSSERLLRRAGS